MSDPSGPPPDELTGMVPMRRGVVAGIVITTIVVALGAAVVWRATFPDIDDDRPPSATPAGGFDAND